MGESDQNRRLYSIEGGKPDSINVSNTYEELEDRSVRLESVVLAIEHHHGEEQIDRLGVTTRFLRNGFLMMQELAHSGGHRSLSDISNEFATAYALAAPQQDQSEAYNRLMKSNAEALHELREAMFEPEAQFVADYPQGDWSDRELKEAVFDGIGQSAAILRLILPQNEGEETSAYLARCKDFMQRSIDSIREESGKADEAISLIKNADEIIDALERLEVRPETRYDRGLTLLRMAVSMVVGLAREPKQNPLTFAQAQIQQFDKLPGEQGRRAESMRLFDSLEFLEETYDELARSNDPEADAVRHRAFLEKEFSSETFANPETEKDLRKILHHSYEILKILAGPEAANHDDLIEVINRLKIIFLHQGARITNPDGVEAGHLRYLAWQDFPEPESK
ncbi:MAG TPA: hypothetical protein VFT49_04095 [Candidatus Saccharimonadales bacterium]|nr:hypothetical protein [Candidatus Saccharimonadales bacterium]